MPGLSAQQGAGLHTVGHLGVPPCCQPSWPTKAPRSWEGLCTPDITSFTFAFLSPTESHRESPSLHIITLLFLSFQMMDAIKGTMTEIYNDLSKNTTGSTIAEVSGSWGTPSSLGLEPGPWETGLEPLWEHWLQAHGLLFGCEHRWGGSLNRWLGRLVLLPACILLDQWDWTAALVCA